MEPYNGLLQRAKSDILFPMKELSEHEVQSLIDMRNFSEAAIHLRRLSKDGSSWAAMNMGWMYEYGSGVTRDVRQAADYYELAAPRDPDGYYRLGAVLEEQGRLREARDAFDNGMQAGHLGCTYRFGWRIFDDANSEAEKWQGHELIIEAANSGHLFAVRKLIGIEWRTTTSVVVKAKLVWRAFRLALRTGLEGSRNPNSELIH